MNGTDREPQLRPGSRQVRVPDWVPQWVTRSRAGERSLSRGTAEASVLVVIGSLVAGVLFGTGLTRTAVTIGDGLTWFGDDPTGEVIQVNPATGKPEARLDVGDPGDTLGVSQWDGRLVVTNQTTGQLTSYDLSSILVSGQRRVATGAGTEVLHHDDSVYLVDRDHSSLAAIDPVSTDTIGQMWQSPAGIADAAVDGQGHLWVIDPQGMLTELHWSASSGAFVTDDQRAIDHSGAGSVLVAHDQGVTVFGPDSGIVVQSDLASGDEAVVAGAPRLSGQLLTPLSAPADLVPVSSPSTGTVVIVSGGKVHEVDVSAIGCSHPATPEVFADQVYVPCPGDHKVVRLTAEGGRSGEDIAVPDGGDPALIVDDGKLLINVPGADHGVVVDEDGAVSSIVRYDDTVPTLTGEEGDDDTSGASETASQDTPTTLPSVAVSPSSRPSSGPSAGPSSGPTSGPTRGPTQRPSSAPTTAPSDSPTKTIEVLPSATIPTAGPLQKPYGVTAVSLPTGEIQVSWSYGRGALDGFTVEETGGQPLVRVDALTRRAVVTVDPGQHRFTVTATRADSTSVTSSSTGTVSASARPGAPGKVTGKVQGSDSSPVTTVSLAWGAADDNGSPILDYQVVAEDSFGTHELTATGTTATYQVTCPQAYCDPGPVTVSVAARNSVGSSDPVGATLQYLGPQPPPLPAGGQQLVTGSDTQWDDPQAGTGTTVLTLSPPADWAGFTGTCSWSHSGNQLGGEGGQTYPCGSGSVSVPINTGYQTSGDGTVSHSIVFTATGVRGDAVQSAPYAWTTQQQVITGDIP